MNSYLITIVMLFLSNIFMTFAWYAHLKNLSDKHWIVASFISWGIAFFEYMIQVPANRIGYQVMSTGELKILQEVITLTIFIPFSLFYMKEKITLDYIYSGLCIMAGVYFMFRSKF